MGKGAFGVRVKLVSNQNSFEFGEKKGELTSLGSTDIQRIISIWILKQLR